MLALPWRPKSFEDSHREANPSATPNCTTVSLPHFLEWYVEKLIEKYRRIYDCLLVALKPLLVQFRKCLFIFRRIGAKISSVSDPSTHPSLLKKPLSKKSKKDSRAAALARSLLPYVDSGIALMAETSAFFSTYIDTHTFSHLQVRIRETLCCIHALIHAFDRAVDSASSPEASTPAGLIRPLVGKLRAAQADAVAAAKHYEAAVHRFTHVLEHIERQVRRVRSPVEDAVHDIALASQREHAAYTAVVRTTEALYAIKTKLSALEDDPELIRETSYGRQGEDVLDKLSSVATDFMRICKVLEHTGAVQQLSASEQTPSTLSRESIGLLSQFVAFSSTHSLDEVLGQMLARPSSLGVCVDTLLAAHHEKLLHPHPPSSSSFSSSSSGDGAGSMDEVLEFCHSFEPEAYNTTLQEWAVVFSRTTELMESPRYGDFKRSQYGLQRELRQASAAYERCINEYEQARRRYVYTQHCFEALREQLAKECHSTFLMDVRIVAQDG